MNGIIQVGATGGTIDKKYATRKGTENYHVGPPIIKKIFKAEFPDISIYVKSLMKVDSLNMTDRQRLKIKDFINERNAREFLITHGTDTVIESALICDEILKIQNKVAVFFGAAQPYDSRSSDSTTVNIGYALARLQGLSENDNFGAYISMNGQLFNAHEVEKCDDGIFRKI